MRFISFLFFPLKERGGEGVRGLRGFEVFDFRL